MSPPGLDGAAAAPAATVAPQPPAVSPNAVQLAVNRGVSVEWLVRWTTVHDLWDTPTWKVVETLVKPSTTGKKCRFVDLGVEALAVDTVGPDVGAAHAFVSHAWANRWGELVTAAEQYSQPGRRVWIDCLAVNQHEPAMDLELLKNVIQEVPEGLLLVIDPHHPIEETDRCPMRRAWCVFEIFNAMMAKVPVLLKMGRMRDRRKYLPVHRRRRQIDPPQLDAAGASAGAADGDGDVATVVVNYEFETVWDKKLVDRLVDSISLSRVTSSREEDRTKILDHVAQHFDHFKVEETIRNAIWAGWTSRTVPALHYAVQGREALKASGLSLEDGNPEGWTALHCAAACGLREAVGVLIDLGANLEAKCSKDRSALMHAAWSGQTRTLVQLIDAGGDVKTVDLFKKNAAFYCRKNLYKGPEWQECLDVLAKHGVKPPPKRQHKPRARQPQRDAAAGDDGGGDGGGEEWVKVGKPPRSKSPNQGRNRRGKSPKPLHDGRKRDKSPKSRGFGPRGGEVQGRGRGQSTPQHDGAVKGASLAPPATD